MTTCSLFVGWRGTGKSTIARRFAKELNAPLFDRDPIRLELTGGRYYDPYCYNPRMETDVLIERLKGSLPKEPRVIFLDYYTGFRRERENLILRLRLVGITRIEAVKIITPCDFCYPHFVAREKALGASYISSAETYRNDFDLIEKESKDIENEGFDTITYVDTRQLYLW